MTRLEFIQMLQQSRLPPMARLMLVAAFSNLSDEKFAVALQNARELFLQIRRGELDETRALFSRAGLPTALVDVLLQ